MSTPWSSDWHPFDRLREQMNDLFDRRLLGRGLFQGWFERNSSLPRVNMTETDQGLLTLLGRVTRKSVKDVTQLYEEFLPGDYYRAFRLGVDVDEGSVSAEVNHGVLTVTLRKSRHARIRRIDVR